MSGGDCRILLFTLFVHGASTLVCYDVYYHTERGGMYGVCFVLDLDLPPFKGLVLPTPTMPDRRVYVCVM